MSCEHVKNLLSAYLDNMLATEEREMVTEHIQTCASCYALQEDFRRFDALLSQVPRVGPTPMLRRRIFSSSEYLELTGTSGSTKWVEERWKPQL
jgi:predicted anti-sigma-YlaC factor YlaD